MDEFLSSIFNLHQIKYNQLSDFLLSWILLVSQDIKFRSMNQILRFVHSNYFKIYILDKTKL